MKLSLRGEYALRALIVLGLHPPEKVVPIQIISKQQNIPKAFLEQILHDMRSVGIVESKRGIMGGYRLGRPADEITLAQVIRHIEGPLAPVKCASDHFYQRCSCPSEEKCGIRSVMKEVRDAIVGILEQVTVAQLCERVRALQGIHSDPMDYII